MQETWVWSLGGKHPLRRAAAAESHQLCMTLCDPIDGSPLGSSVLGILQARILGWVAVSFSNAWMHAKSLQSCPTLCDPMDSSPPGSSVHRILQQEHWSGLPGWVALPRKKEMATHSSILAWRILWTEEPDRLQSMGSQRVGHDWVTFTSLHFNYSPTRFVKPDMPPAKVVLLIQVKNR